MRQSSGTDSFERSIERTSKPASSKSARSDAASAASVSPCSVVKHTSGFSVDAICSICAANFFSPLYAHAFVVSSESKMKNASGAIRRNSSPHSRMIDVV